MGDLDSSALVLLTRLWTEQSQYDASLVRKHWLSEQIKLQLKINHTAPPKRDWPSNVLGLIYKVFMVCKHMYGTMTVVI